MENHKRYRRFYGSIIASDCRNKLVDYRQNHAEAIKIYAANFPVKELTIKNAAQLIKIRVGINHLFKLW